MTVSYTCTNPDCGVTLKTPKRVEAGKSVKCPKCGTPFIPEPVDAAGAGTLKLADDQTKQAGAKPAAPAPTPAAPKSRFADDEEDDESIKRGYGVIKETEAEIEEGKKNKPKFTEVQDKFKKSARGPAQALLVMPSNLLLAAGLILTVISIVFFIYGMWPLVFNDAPPGEEELDEAVFRMMLGVIGFIWGGMICFGASQMQELGSYTWATIGGIMGVPLIVGLFAVIMLQNPKVKNGFEEAEAGPDEEDEDDEDEDDDDEDGEEDDDDDGDDDDDDDEDSVASTSAKKAGRKLLRGMLGSEEDDE